MREKYFPLSPWGKSLEWLHEKWKELSPRKVGVKKRSVPVEVAKPQYVLHEYVGVPWPAV